MPKYYHLSADDHLTEIVKENNDFTKGQIVPRVPEDSYGEDQTPRVCFCPSVWQCVLSKPNIEKLQVLNIYEINVDELSDPKGIVGDRD